MFHLPFCNDHGGAAVLCEWHKVHEIHGLDGGVWWCLSCRGRGGMEGSGGCGEPGWHRWDMFSNSASPIYAVVPWDQGDTVC